MNNHVHPLFAACINSHAARTAVKAAYQNLLMRHDWSYEDASDQNAWKAGKAERAALEAMQKEIDPTFGMWNEIAPQAYRAVVIDGELTAARRP